MVDEIDFQFPANLCAGRLHAMVSALKSAIPLFNDYTCDLAFFDLDVASHETDPFRLLQQLLGHPAIKFVRSMLYEVWVFPNDLGCLLSALFSRDEFSQQQYFIAFFLALFAIGVLIATMFASMGP
jgi:hypothetical protein